MSFRSMDGKHPASSLRCKYCGELLGTEWYERSEIIEVLPYIPANALHVVYKVGHSMCDDLDLHIDHHEPFGCKAIAAVTKVRDERKKKAGAEWGTF